MSSDAMVKFLPIQHTVISSNHDTNFSHSNKYYGVTYGDIMIYHT